MDRIEDFGSISSQSTGSRSGATGIAIMAVVIYGTSFFLPAFWIGDVHARDIQAGYVAFETSGLSIFSDVARYYPQCFVIFLANPLLWIGVVCFIRRHYLTAWLTGATAAIIGTSAFFWKGSECLLVGYYLWVLSTLLLTTAGITAWWHAPPTASGIRGFDVVIR